MGNDYTPVEIDPDNRLLLEKVGRLRVLAWSTMIPGAALHTDCWLDEFELDARHWVIFHDGEPVAAARLSVHDRLEDVPDTEVYSGARGAIPPGRVASLNRLVTRPDFRGRGFSDALDAVRVSALGSVGCVCSVSTSSDVRRRVEQLGVYGFEPVGPPATEPAGSFFSGGVAQPMFRPAPRTGCAECH